MRESSERDYINPGMNTLNSASVYHSVSAYSAERTSSYTHSYVSILVWSSLEHRVCGLVTSRVRKYKTLEI